jgi:Adenylate cyclase associated (CAP) N terminal
VLCGRLEAATSRLEDLAVANTHDFREAQAAQRSSATPSLSKDVTPQFNTGVFTPETRHSVSSEPVIEEEKSPVITDYEKLIKDQIEPWISKSDKIGSVVGEQVQSILMDLELIPITGHCCRTFVSSAAVFPPSRLESPKAFFSSGIPYRVSFQIDPARSFSNCCLPHN